VSREARFAHRKRLTRTAAAASVTLALLLLGLKLWASLATGSVAMLGSLADTALDLVASLVTLVGVRVAAEPADSDHRFGHGKAEAIAALFQALLIWLSVLGIALRAGQRLAEPHVVDAPELGIGVSIAAIAATLLLVAYQRRVVAHTGSLAIHTDQLHYQSDVLLNLSVIAALVLDAMLGFSGADPIFGLAIAGYLGWSALGSARRAIDVLMDREWSADDRARLQALVVALPGIEGIHDLRTRRSGAVDFIQFHIWVDPVLTVHAAHDIVDGVEAAVLKAWPDAEVLIHVDPAGHVDAKTLLSPPEDTRLAD
jgi:ferrous-iron efflux pump FieF